jgi:tetratricopeptide (TPR) repeat protein
MKKFSLFILFSLYSMTNCLFAQTETKYYLIAGSYKTEAQAQSEVDKLKAKGYPAEIVDKNKEGNIRISYYSYNNINDANAKMYKLKSNGITNVWVYKGNTITISTNKSATIISAKNSEPDWKNINTNFCTTCNGIGLYYKTESGISYNKTCKGYIYTIKFVNETGKEIKPSGILYIRNSTKSPVCDIAGDTRGTKIEFTDSIDPLKPGYSKTMTYTLHIDTTINSIPPAPDNNQSTFSYKFYEKLENIVSYSDTLCGNCKGHECFTYIFSFKPSSIGSFYLASAHLEITGSAKSAIKGVTLHYKRRMDETGNYSKEETVYFKCDSNGIFKMTPQNLGSIYMDKDPQTGKHFYDKKDIKIISHDIECSSTQVNNSKDNNENSNIDQQTDTSISSEQLHKAIELEKNNPNGTNIDKLGEAYYNCGIAYKNNGLFDKAINDYNKAIELKPGYADAYYNRGIAYKNKGLYDTAMIDYNKAIKLNPQNSEYYNQLGIVYWKKELLDQAIAAYSKAIELKPDFESAYNNRGHAYWKKGLNDKALVDYDKAIELNPVYAGAYNNRGLVYIEKGLDDKACLDFKKAEELGSEPAKSNSSKYCK